jgi:hypothetical protein
MKQLLEAAIDYAGLFPPSSLPMPAAIEEYAESLSGAFAWMLGRMVLPVSRLAEFSEELDRCQPADIEQTRWRVSAIAGPNVEADVTTILKFNAQNTSSRRKRGAMIDSVEIKVARPEEVYAAAQHIPQQLSAFFELPLSEATPECISAVRQSHAFAKVRTGGIKAEQIPSCAALAGFILLAVKLNVAFKATAGLHHAIRGYHSIAGDQGTASIAMHGFLNLLFAVAVARGGFEEQELTAVLEEQVPKAFQFSADGAAWSGHRLTGGQLAETRRGSIRSWGSCSFKEPLEDLRALGLL